MAKTERYIGTCRKYGLVRHEAQSEAVAIKGGTFCPFCGTILTDSKKDSTPRVSRGKEILPTPFFEKTSEGWVSNKEAKL